MVRGTDLDNRSVTEAEHAIRRMRAKPEPEAVMPGAEQELAALKARIAEARKLPPPHYSIVDGRSWAMGRDAALAALDGP